MAVFLSPSIQIQEFDLSTIIQSLSSTEIASLYTGNRGPTKKTYLTPANVWAKIGRKNLNYTHFGILKMLEEVDHVIGKRVVKDSKFGGLVVKKGTSAVIQSGNLTPTPSTPIILSSSIPNLIKINTSDRSGLATIPNGTYNTLASLVSTLQTQIDLAIGTGVILVGTSGQKLTFTDISSYGTESLVYFSRVSDTNAGNIYSELSIPYVDELLGTIDNAGAPSDYKITGTTPLTMNYVGWYVQINGVNYPVNSSSSSTDIHFDATGLTALEAQTNVPFFLLQKGTGGVIQKTGAELGQHPENYTFQTDELFLLYNENPGSWSKEISAQISSYDPNTNSFTIALYSLNDDGSFGYTGESFTVSRNPDQKDLYGRNLYIESIINDNSNYVRVVNNAVDTVYTKIPSYQTGLIVFGEGTNESVPLGEGDFVTAWDDFANPDEIYITIMIQNGLGGLSVWNKIIAIAEKRMDCIGILDGIYGMSKEEIAQQTGRIDSSYVGVFYDWQKDLDSVNNKNINLPVSVYVGNRLGYTDRTAEPWYATAGKRRGQIRSLGSRSILSKSDRDFLYPRKVNPIRDISGVGVYIWGSTTAQKRFSALSDLNVRRGLNILEQAVARYMEDYQWEFNDEPTRAELFFTVDSYCKDLQRRRFMVNYKVICDSTNNTAEVINRKEIIVDILIQPNIAAQFGLLRIFVSKQGTSFETGTV